MQNDKGNLQQIISVEYIIRRLYFMIRPERADIVIPVYLGGTMLDEIVVNAQQRINLRSGGR